MLTEAERKAIVEGGPVWLSDGLKARFVGWADPYMCGVHSARPGYWECSWETAQTVLGRPNRRFDFLYDSIFRTGHGWLGLTPDREDFQTEEDYERAVRAGRYGLKP